MFYGSISIKSVTSYPDFLFSLFFRSYIHTYIHTYCIGAPPNLHLAAYYFYITSPQFFASPPFQSSHSSRIVRHHLLCSSQSLRIFSGLLGLCLCACLCVSVISDGLRLLSIAFHLDMSSHTAGFVASGAAHKRTLPCMHGSNTARTVVEEGRRRARTLMYGAGGAFRGLTDRRHEFERIMRASLSSGFGGHWKDGWNYNNNNNNNNNSNNNNNNRSDGDAGDDDFNVDPSWGVAPGVHVILRGKADDTYRAAVANLLAMSSALSAAAPAAFVDAATPVVLILSWMGARQKHLERYRKFYEGLGYEVHLIFNDLRTAIVPSASRAQARKIGQFIEGQPEERPVFVHAFSIGTGIYGIMLDSLRHEADKFEQFRKRVTGVIFDSGPAPIFPQDVAKGLHTVCPMISKAMWEPIAATFFFITQARQFYSRSEDALRKIQFPAPQLYFYSGDDKVIPNLKNSVEEFIEKNKQRGLEVYNKFWEKSVHASHMKIHPDDYLANLSQFINRCMEIRTQNPAADNGVAQITN